MIFWVLFLAVLFPIPTCIFRMKRYGLNWRQTIIVYIIISTVGALGAFVGSALADMAIGGIRLYGLMLFDAIAVPFVSKLIKHDSQRLGDFISVPIMVVCASAKIICLLTNCCSGIVLGYDDMQNPIRFPSQMFEILIWCAMAVFILTMEHRKRSQHMLWPVTMMWFGILRFAVDFLRAPTLKTRPLLLGMTGGKFWSLVVFVYGFIWLYIGLRKKIGRLPTLTNIAKTLIGAYVVE